MIDVLAVVTDLYFQARIAAAARAAGRSVRFVSGPGAVADEDTFGVALVDLDAGPIALEAIQALRGNSDTPIIAFGPHVDTDLRKAARVAGAHRVLARSKFATELPAIMTGARAQ